jgi:hypothetical protein
MPKAPDRNDPGPGVVGEVVWSALPVGGGGGQLVGLVDERDRDLLQRFTVLTGVVGAEKELATGLELHAKVGLGSAPVAAVRCGKRSAGCDCSVHDGLISVLGVVSAT